MTLGLVSCRPVRRLREFSAQRGPGKTGMALPEISAGAASLLPSLKPCRTGQIMVSQPYVDGIMDTVPHGIASRLAGGQIAADEDTLSVAVPVLTLDDLATLRWSPAVMAARSPAGQRTWRSVPARSPSGCRAAERASHPLRALRGAGQRRGVLSRRYQRSPATGTSRCIRPVMG